LVEKLLIFFVRGFTMKTCNHLFLPMFIVLLFFSGCSTVATTTASGTASLKAEGMAIWSRPLEFGFTIIGVGEATAESGAQKVIDTAPTFFMGGSVDQNKMTPLAKLAAYNAIKKFDADGMYITMVKETDNGSSKEAWVRGVMLKLKPYGPVDEIRADKERCCNCSGSGE
jgi:hypothetical protein